MNQELLDRLREADPGCYHAYGTMLAAYGIVEGSAMSEAWLQACIQAAIRVRKWGLSQWRQYDPTFPEIECVINCPIKDVPDEYKGRLYNNYFGKGSTEAEALCLAYIEAVKG